MNILIKEQTFTYRNQIMQGIEIFRCLIMKALTVI